MTTLAARLLPLAALALAAAPAHAGGSDPAAEARSMIEAHQVNLAVGCSIPVPTTYNAPEWQQRAAALRRQSFEQCLRSVMAREESRLGELEARVSELAESQPDLDWSPVTSAMAAKWDELDRLNDRLNARLRWADTAANVLDTFTGPGAPLDSGAPPRTTRYNPYNPYRPVSPAYPYYRPDSSVSFPGIR